MMLLVPSGTKLRSKEMCRLQVETLHYGMVHHSTACVTVRYIKIQTRDEVY